MTEVYRGYDTVKSNSGNKTNLGGSYATSCANEAAFTRDAEYDLGVLSGSPPLRRLIL